MLSEKSPGDPIRSDEWNELVRMAKKLETDQQNLMKLPSLTSDLQADQKNLQELATRLQTDQQSLKALTSTLQADQENFNAQKSALQTSLEALEKLAQNLQKDKLGTTGGTVSGTLQVDTLNVIKSLLGPNLGIEFVAPRNNQWDFTTTSSDWLPVISRQLEFVQPTTVLAIGHGAGKANDGRRPLNCTIFCDGLMQMTDGLPIVQDSQEEQASQKKPASQKGPAWGMGCSVPSTESLRHMAQIVTLAKCKVSPGTHTFELRYRARPSDPKDPPVTGEVTLTGPSLWLLKLGDFS